jgi:hypothetical protein
VVQEYPKSRAGKGYTIAGGEPDGVINIEGKAMA